MKNILYLTTLILLSILAPPTFPASARDTTWQSPGRGSTPPSPVQAQSNASSTAIGRWRLVRSPGPEGRQVVSIMHTADELKSDPDFAGLMIRCRENPALQVALVVIRPFPPRAKIQIAISTDHTTIRMPASVLPSGIVLALPNEAEALAKGPWRSVKNLSFSIEGGGSAIHGIVPIEDLSGALDFLQSNCPEK